MATTTYRLRHANWICLSVAGMLVTATGCGLSAYDARMNATVQKYQAAESQKFAEAERLKKEDENKKKPKKEEITISKEDQEKALQELRRMGMSNESGEANPGAAAPAGGAAQNPATPAPAPATPAPTPPASPDARIPIPVPPAAPQ